MSEAIEKYIQEVSSKKPSGQSEKVRLTDLTPNYFSNWRDYRLDVDKVKGSTVNREFKIFNDLFNVAKNEWKWIAENP